MIIVSIITNNSIYLTEEGWEKHIPLAFAVLIIVFVLYMVIEVRQKTKKYNQEQLKAKQDAEKNKNLNIKKHRDIVDYDKRDVEQARKNLIVTKDEARLIDLQIEDIVNKRKVLQANLSSFYSFGIIPPDYRYMDCVIILDQIFRNDLADTMREAIKIYDEREFRGSVIRGMDKICSMLGQLSSDMSAISLRLDMINSSVTQMGDDLFKANQRLMKNQRELIDESIKNRAATENLIRETQLGRYTNEKLLESNKRLEYYAEEYRMGRMPRDFMN